MWSKLQNSLFFYLLFVRFPGPILSGLWHLMDHNMATETFDSNNNSLTSHLIDLIWFTNNFCVKNTSSQFPIINQYTLLKYNSKSEKLVNFLTELFKSQISLEAKVWSVKLWSVKCRKTFCSKLRVSVKWRIQDFP